MVLYKRFRSLILKLCNFLIIQLLLLYLVNLIDLNLFRNGFGSVSCLERVCGEFISENLKSSRGEFEIDSWIASDKDANRFNDSLLCIYKFVGNKDEKVLINFKNFDIVSIAPDCINEYVDIYIEVTDETLNNYVETNFLSRWCGSKKPHTLVSYHNIIVFAYHTDGTNRGTHFSGTFEFIENDDYNYGRKSENSCEYEFNSESSESGMFLSPTYPGTYPNILNCTYKFIGRPDERVLIYFDEILIHYGADHCPYDVIKFYDYQKSDDTSTYLTNENNNKNNNKYIRDKQEIKKQKFEKILFDSYCGRKLNFSVYSTNNLFEIEFEMSDSLGNEEYSEDETKILLRKGFKAFYKFSKDYADLSFITGTHITGTNCDQKISSTIPSGVIYSPNYFRSKPINASCKYIFEGLNDNHDLESVKLNFYMIDVKQSTAKNICNENSVSHFIVYGSDRNKSKYCFNRLTKEPKEIRSLGSQMTLIFNSINADQYTPSNFKAGYSFYTEFGIEGTRVYQNRTCLFTYNSENTIHGFINSPRYPQNYPLNIKCFYVFDILSKFERVLFTFKEFKLSGLNPSNCSKIEDHLSIYQSNEDPEGHSLIKDSHYDRSNKQSWTLSNRFCGSSMLPSPFISDVNAKKVLVTFYSDNLNYAHGFNLNYNYVKLPECKYKYHANDNVSNGQIIITNDLEGTYYCEWYISADSDKSILLSFKNMNLDDPKSNQFVIKVYDLNANLLNLNDHIFYDPNMDYVSDLNTLSHGQENEIDQEKNSNVPKYEYVLDKSIKYFQIDSNNIKLQLVIGKAMLMENGKLIINWITATKNRPCKSDEFMCNQTQYCIKTDYYCDGIDHCPRDSSDEPDKCIILNSKQSTFYPPLIQIALFIASIVLLVIFLSICLICRFKSDKRSRIKKKSPPKESTHPPIYYKYSPAVSSVDYLEAAITSV